MFVSSTFFKKQFDVSKAQLIGQGNFAQVYRVFDPDTQKYLAIRRVDRSLGQSEDIQKQKTINEELRRVQNQNILQIFDIIEGESCIWYITQYCEGGSLWDALNNCIDNKMNEKDALQCIYQISKGVKQLHNHRITHRDLKPENILLKTKYIANKPIPTIKLADFGLSTKKIIMQTIAGTKEYIAPEQARFHNYTNAVDVWSLGIIFDQILHGTPYYVGDNNKEVFQKILKNPYKIRDQTIRPSIQQLLISVLKKKAYERPIIAVICQSIQKILEQIRKQKQKTQIEDILQKPQKPQKLQRTQKPNFQKKALKNLHSFQQQIKSPVFTPLSESVPTQLNVYFKQILEDNKVESKGEDKSSTKKEERKAKTPFKRQNGRPQLFKSTEQIQPSNQSTTSIGLSYLQRTKPPATNKKQIQTKILNRDFTKQNLTQIQPDQKRQAIESQKVNVYRIDKRKAQPLHSKGLQLLPNVVDIKQYMQNMVKLKNDLLQNSITITKQRQFILNAQLTVADFPQKFQGQQILKRLKKNYDFLNYVNYKQDYEMRLCTGKNTLTQQKSKAETQMLQHKQKIKKTFLAQVEKYVDYYVQKTLK